MKERKSRKFFTVCKCEKKRHFHSTNLTVKERKSRKFFVGRKYYPLKGVHSSVSHMCSSESCKGH